MKEPILSREEVLGFASDAFGIDYDRLDARFEKYAALIESALLKKLCGEPIYQARQLSDEASRWDDVYEATHSACASQPQFYETRIVYALNRSKA